MEVRHPEVAGYDGWHPRGQGPRGLIFDARHTASGRSVTVIVVDGPGDDGRLDRLGALVTDLAAHPDPTGVVVPVLDVGRVADGRLYLAAPASPGWTLQAVLDTHGRCPPQVAAGHLAPIARALASVHDRGLVHGRLTPSAIVVDGTGRTTLVEVGIAAILGGTPRSDLAAFAYTPPEAMRGERLAPSNDIYALGLTLATLIIGHNPLGPQDGETAFAYVARRRGDPGSPLGWGDIDGALGLADACVSPRPEDRPTATEVARILEAIADPSASTRDLLTPPAPRPPPDEGPLAPGQLPHQTHIGGQTMSAAGGGGGSMSTTTTSAGFAEALAILTSVHGPPESSDDRVATWSTRREQDGWFSAWDTRLSLVEDLPRPSGLADPPPHARCVVSETRLNVPSDPDGRR